MKDDYAKYKHRIENPKKAGEWDDYDENEENAEDNEEKKSEN